MNTNNVTSDRSSVDSEAIEERWKGICTGGAVAAMMMLALMIVQIIVFTIWPPPTSVEGYFTLFRDSWILGLLSLDLLYLVDSVLLIIIYLALYVALRRSGESSMLIALVFGLVGIAAYFASNTAFEMLSLSGQYTAASTEAQRATLLAAGTTMLETWRGTSFDVYYVLNSVVLFIVSAVMIRSRLFSRTTAYLGFAAGVLMIIPSSAGRLGLYVSLASLLPWAVWLVLAGRRFLQLGRRRSLAA